MTTGFAWHMDPGVHFPLMRGWLQQKRQAPGRPNGGINHAPPPPQVHPVCDDQSIASYVTRAVEVN